MTSETEASGNKEEASLYFVLFATLLAVVIILSRILHDFPGVNYFISEASLVLVVGMIAGYLAHLFIAQHQIEEYVIANEDGEEIQVAGLRVASHLLSFSPNIFFMALLPPILFNSGYQLRRELFYRHIKPIVLFACLGTTITALSTAFSLYGVKQLGWMGDFDPSLLELLTFGSLIAATDTVSVLGVFQSKRVDPHLFYLVFGESALNDAVALVLFKTFSEFLRNDYLVDGAGTVARRAAYFFVEVVLAAIFSPALGIIFGFGSALIFKYLDFRNHPNLELPLYMVMLLYVPFIVAEQLELSGIVTIFFSGISARRYVSLNVSDQTVQSAENLFKLASYLAETCIFLELGMSVFGLTNSFQWSFICWAFIATMLGRAIGIYPLAFLFNFSLKVRMETLQRNIVDIPPGLERELTINSQASSISSHSTVVSESTVSTNSGFMTSKRKTPQKRKDKQIPPSFMHMLWFAGLRGAVAYACVRDFPDIFGHNDEFIAATVVIVLITIVIMGGATEHLLRSLGIQMGVDEDNYMTEWYKHRRLNGYFHSFEYKYIYGVVVRNETDLDENSNSRSRRRTEKAYSTNTELDHAFQYQSETTLPTTATGSMA